MSVARSSFVFASGTFLSRISGLVRESVMGAVFGASLFLDAYLVAFRIPNLLRELIAEGALGSSFTRVYSSLCVDDPQAAEKALIQTLQLVTLISICVCGIGVLWAGPLVNLMTADNAIKDQTEFLAVATSLTQLLFPFVGFAAFGAVVQGALYQRGGFFLAAVAPILFNILSIAGALWFGGIAESLFSSEVISYFGGSAIFGLAIGTLLGGAAQSGVQLWGIWRPLLKGRLLWPKTFPWSKDIQKIFVLMTPMAIAASAGQVNLVVNTNFATSLETGAVSWLSFAFRLIQLPIGMFGVAIGAAVLPSLTKAITEAGGRVDTKASKEVVNALDLVTWLMLPCMILMYGSAADITRVLYQAGRFTAEDTAATAIAIQAYSLGLLGYGLLKVLNSFYYAVDRTRYPMMVSLFSIAVNFAANFLLVKTYGHQGLAMTASVVLTLNAVLLLAGMVKHRIAVDLKVVGQSIGLLLFGTVAVVSLRYFYEPILADFSWTTHVGLEAETIAMKLDAALRLVIDGVVIVGIFAAIGLTRIGKSPKEALRMLKRRR